MHQHHGFARNDKLDRDSLAVEGLLVEGDSCTADGILDDSGETVGEFTDAE